MHSRRCKSVVGVPIEAVELDPTEEEKALQELEIEHTPSANLTSRIDGAQAQEALQESLTPSVELSNQTEGFQTCLDPMMSGAMVSDQKNGLQTGETWHDPSMPSTMPPNQTCSFQTGKYFDPMMPCANQNNYFTPWLVQETLNAKLLNPTCLDPTVAGAMITDHTYSLQTGETCHDPMMLGAMLSNQTNSVQTDEKCLDPLIPCVNQIEFLPWLVQEFLNATLPNQMNGLCHESVMSCLNLTCNGYHTHQEDGIDICSEFLSGQCYLGPVCPDHHTVLPYAWQMRDIRTYEWSDVKAGAQESLERLYCNPKVVQVTGMHNGLVVKLDFSTMTVHHSNMYDKLRRLSTSSSAAAPFCTTYKYYYEDCGDNWLAYTQDFVESIERGLREKSESVVCSNALFSYKVDLLALNQENLQTGTVRKIRKRPVFKSSVMITCELGTQYNFKSPGIGNTATKQYLNISNTDLKYPLNWVITEVSLRSDSERIPLKREDREFQLVYRCFHSTMSESLYVILEICRVQNYFQWEKYSRKRDYMKRQLVEIESRRMERYLFHGTHPDVVEVICKQNFDPRVSGANGTIYGNGCYFARDASLSHGFSREDQYKHYFMFLAKVLVGRAAKGNSKFRRPPPIYPNDPASPLYDSCVSKHKKPDIFVIFDNDQFYPYFLIKYQKMQDMVLLD